MLSNGDLKLWHIFKFCLQFFHRKSNIPRAARNSVSVSVKPYSKRLSAKLISDPCLILAEGPRWSDTSDTCVIRSNGPKGHEDPTLIKQARKLQATLVQNYDPLTHLLTGVKCRATSVAKNMRFYCKTSFAFFNELVMPKTTWFFWQTRFENWITCTRVFTHHCLFCLCLISYVYLFLLICKYHMCTLCFPRKTKLGYLCLIC